MAASDLQDDRAYRSTGDDSQQIMGREGRKSDTGACSLAAVNYQCRLSSTIMRESTDSEIDLMKKPYQQSGVESKTLHNIATERIAIDRQQTDLDRQIMVVERSLQELKLEKSHRYLSEPLTRGTRVLPMQGEDVARQLSDEDSVHSHSLRGDNRSSEIDSLQGRIRDIEKAIREISAQNEKTKEVVDSVKGPIQQLTGVTSSQHKQIMSTNPKHTTFATSTAALDDQYNLGLQGDQREGWVDFHINDGSPRVAGDRVRTSRNGVNVYTSTPMPRREPLLSAREMYGGTPRERGGFADLNVEMGGHATPASWRPKGQNHHTNHTLQSPKYKKPATYDGKTSWHDYLVHFEMIAEINGWDETMMVMELATGLRDAAQGVLSDLEISQRRDYHHLVAALTARFEPENQAEMFRAQLKSRVRGRGEPLGQLAQEIKKLVRQALV